MVLTEPHNGTLPKSKNQIIFQCKSRFSFEIRKKVSTLAFNEIPKEHTKSYN
jgi:hypothetical protein